MKKSTTLWLIIAAALVLAGSIVFTGVMMMLNWDFSQLSTVKYQTTEYTISEDFKNIAINIDTADIAFVAAEKATVICHEQKNATHRVTVENGSLVVKSTDERKWYEHIGIGFETPKITVYLPQGAYDALTVSSSTGNVDIPADFSFRRIHITESTGRVTCLASATEAVTIKATTGDIRVEDIATGQLDLTVSTGKVTVSGVDCSGDAVVSVSTGDANLSDLSCKNFISSGNTGDIDLKNVIATETFSITRSTGDVKFDGCDAGEITVTTDTGSVKGSLLSGKIFITHTDTGSVHVPDSVTGGKCQITTDTGNIKITIAGK